MYCIECVWNYCTNVLVDVLLWMVYVLVGEVMILRMNFSCLEKRGDRIDGRSRQS